LKDFGSFSLVFPLLEILPAAKMKELVAEKLSECEYETEDDGTLTKGIGGGAKVIFNPDTVSAKITVPVPEEWSVMVEDIRMERFREMINNAEQNGLTVDKEYGHAKGNIVKSVESTLLPAVMEVKAEVNGVLKEVYREAIKEKASTMGSVVGVSETSENGTYRIRVEIEG
jgi:hypothetical protein